MRSPLPSLIGSYRLTRMSCIMGWELDTTKSERKSWPPPSPNAKQISNAVTVLKTESGTYRMCRKHWA